MLVLRGGTVALGIKQHPDGYQQQPGNQPDRLPQTEIGQPAWDIVAADAEHVRQPGDCADYIARGQKPQPDFLTQPVWHRAMACGVSVDVPAERHHPNAEQNHNQLQDANTGVQIQVDDDREHTYQKHGEPKNHPGHARARELAEPLRGAAVFAHSGSPRCNTASQFPDSSCFTSPEP